MTNPQDSPSHSSAPTPRPDDSSQPERMAKTLKSQWVFAVALGSAVGWGAFILPTDWLATGGPLGTLLGFAIGGGLMIIIAVSYSFLIRTFPVSGGELAYALFAFGRVHAFFAGWVGSSPWDTCASLHSTHLLSRCCSESSCLQSSNRAISTLLPAGMSTCPR